MADAIETPVQTSGDFLGTGRRKTAVARVRLRAGQGKITINKRPFEEYFPNDRDRESLLAPLTVTGKRSEVDVWIRIDGGGATGQADASKLGIARALRKYDVTLYEALRDANLLTRDSRMKERKKYGLRGARRGTQFSKR
jgi:small subunit ribosomal protein S9